MIFLLQALLCPTPLHPALLQTTFLSQSVIGKKNLTENELMKTFTSISLRQGRV